MNYWNTLKQAIQTTLNTGRVGTPVFVRCTAALAGPAEPLSQTAAAMASDINTWLAASPARLYALGSPDQGHVTVSLEYPSGCTALLSLALAQARPQIDLAVFGSKGAIYHTEAIQPLPDDQLTPQLPPTLSALTKAIERSLAQGAPVAPEQEATS